MAVINVIDKNVIYGDNKQMNFMNIIKIKKITVQIL